MKEVFGALGIKKVVLIGNSLGGWMALKFATTYPEYVSGLVLIAAGGLTKVHKGFISKVEKAKQADGSIPTGASVIELNNIPEKVLDFMNLIVANFNPIQELPLFEDSALQKLVMPIIFITGEQDEIFDAGESTRRLSALVPSAEICVLPNCGHVVTNSIELFLPFLTKVSMLLRD